MKADIWSLYEKMLFSRLFEEAVIQIWQQGKISAEMHLNIGEEAIIAGIVDHLEDGDAMALDHRGTAPMLMRGVDPEKLLLEFLGHPDGICRGMGGHMHLFAKDMLIASSGIVGASGPGAVGFALSADYQKKQNVAVAFLGEGAMNQGMLLESFNLAAVWKLPIVFVCKDNNMAITTVSSQVTSGSLTARVKGFGIPAVKIEGVDVETVWKHGKEAVDRARRGRGPSFIQATCFRKEGHFLGDPLIRIAREPVKEMKEIAGPLLKSTTKRIGSPVLSRAGSLSTVMNILGKTAKNQMISSKDPLKVARKKVRHDKSKLKKTEKRINDSIQEIIRSALSTAQSDKE